MTDVPAGVFDVYSRPSEDEAWTRVERSMPWVYAQKMANGFIERGVQAKLEPADPANPPSYDDALVGIAGQLTRAATQAAEAIQRYVKGDRAPDPGVRDCLRRVHANAKMLDDYFAQEGFPGRGTGTT